MSPSMTRDNSFDICKASLIFLVILGHFFQSHINDVGTNNDVINWSEYIIYSFHMPAFMFISGWFGCGKKYKLIPYFKSTVLYLCIPLIVWDFIINMYDYVFCKSFNGINSILTSLWYIKSLIIIRIITFPFLRKPTVLNCFLLLLFGLILGQYYLLSLLVPSYVLGYISKKYNLLRNRYMPFIISAYAFELILIHPSLAISDLALIRHIEGYYLFNYLNRLILGLTGTMVYIVLIRHFIRTCNITILNIGKATMGIYMIQAFVVERWISPFVSSNNSCLFFILIAILALFICSIIAMGVRRLKYGFLIIGR